MKKGVIDFNAKWIIIIIILAILISVIATVVIYKTFVMKPKAGERDQSTGTLNIMVRDDSSVSEGTLNINVEE